MKSITIRLLATVLLLPAQAALTFVLIGISQTEFGAPPGTEFPYLLVVLFLFIPLLAAIWMERGGVGRRMVAWLIGLVAVIVSLAVFRSMALRIWAIEVFRGGNPFSVEAGWAVIVFYLLCMAAGFFPVWALLRRTGGKFDGK